MDASPLKVNSAQVGEPSPQIAPFIVRAGQKPSAPVFPAVAVVRRVIAVDLEKRRRQVHPENRTSCVIANIVGDRIADPAAVAEKQDRCGQNVVVGQIGQAVHLVDTPSVERFTAGS